MKNRLLVSMLLLTACGGTLTEEQRKKVKQDMQNHAIIKVSEAQITESAFKIGREISTALEKQTANVGITDSLQKTYHVKITSLRPGSTPSGVEQQIIEAYADGASQGTLSDNVQKTGADSILYTKPFTKDLPDGSLKFDHAIGIKMARKQIVLSLKN